MPKHDKSHFSVLCSGNLKHCIGALIFLIFSGIKIHSVNFNWFFPKNKGKFISIISGIHFLNAVLIKVKFFNQN